jgi:hypothetical protein
MVANEPILQRVRAVLAKTGKTCVPELVATLASLAESYETMLYVEFHTEANPNPSCPELEKARAVLAKTGKTCCNAPVSPETPEPHTGQK